MPSRPSDNYLLKVERWIAAEGEVAIDRIPMRPEQKYRARLTLDAFHAWQKSRLTDPRQLITRLAARDYEMLLKQAEMGNEEAKYYVDNLGLKRDPETGRPIPRTFSEISNDVYVLNWLVGRYSKPNINLNRVIYEDNARWLASVGRKMGNISAVKEAQRNLEVLSNKFQDQEDPQDQMPNTDINITGDVSIIKEGRESMSDEEREKLRKKYGLTEKELVHEMEEINGVYQEVNDEEEEKDIFEETEKEYQ